MADFLKISWTGDKIFKAINDLFITSPKGLKAFVAWYVWEGLSNIAITTRDAIEKNNIYNTLLKRRGKLGKALNVEKEKTSWDKMSVSFGFDRKVSKYVNTHIGKGTQEIVPKRGKYLTVPIQGGPAWVKGTNLKSKSLKDFPGYKFNPKVAIWYLGKDWENRTALLFVGKKKVSIQRTVDPDQILDYAFSQVSTGVDNLISESINKYFEMT